MKIETLIESLLSYAMNKGLAFPEDHAVLLNNLLEVLSFRGFGGNFGRHFGLCCGAWSVRG